ncbi:MAG: alpha/beta hydrolase [Bacteroidales bacterium]|nr:alpha/beta hydrolase [Bacteroidales bacterium]
MKKALTIIAVALMLTACTQKESINQNENPMTTLKLTQEWDKKFPKSDKVEHQKVTFHNRYGIELAADMYTPKGATDKLPAIAVSGPFGAVKEQSSGLYAQHMAEHGFLVIAFDPSFTGESGGEPRRMASPDINTEDFLAAVDFLSNLDKVDPERIGIIGICGFGGMAVNAAAIDPRIKATVAATMYDMSKIAAEGYFGSANSPEARMEQRKAIAAQRTEDYKNGTYKRAGGVVDPLPEDAPWFVKDYHAYYKCPRGYHERSGNSTDGWNVIGTQSFLNQPLLCWAHEIENPVLLIHGEKAHSRYFSEYAFEKMTGVKPQIPENIEKSDKPVETPLKSIVVGNKELMIIPGASHVDLYDDEAGVVPYDKMAAFFNENLK